ncbi:MAG: hypothetical protein PCFJNLEI_00923 [Verrucomicrobiae bacterium]|nr:hypothetical protein [Verrucomicrobiae bacterium]
MTGSIIVACGSDCPMGTAVGVISGLLVAGALLVITTLLWLIFRFVFRLKKRWWISWGSAVAGAVLLAAIAAPALHNARLSARRTSGNCNLKQIGLALAQYSSEHNEVLPADLNVLIDKYLGSAKPLTDPATCKPFIYVGAGLKWQSDYDTILAFSPDGDRGRNVLFNDGHVTWLTEAGFSKLVQRGAIKSGTYF